MARDPRFVSNTQRVANRAALDGLVGAALANLTREVAMARLNAAGVACGALNELDDLIAHPQRRVMSVTTPHGEVELMTPGARASGELVVPRSVPELGEHDEKIRREFGPAG